MVEEAMTKFLEIAYPSDLNSTWRKSWYKKQTLQLSDLCLPVAFVGTASHRGQFLRICPTKVQLGFFVRARLFAEKWEQRGYNACMFLTSEDLFNECMTAVRGRSAEGTVGQPQSRGLACSAAMRGRLAAWVTFFHFLNCNAKYIVICLDIWVSMT